MLVKLFRPLFKKSPKVQSLSQIFQLMIQFNDFYFPFLHILDDDGAGNGIGFKPQINLQVLLVFESLYISKYKL